MGCRTRPCGRSARRWSGATPTLSSGAAVNLADQSLLVQQGKGNKSRTFYRCEEALTALREWLAVRRPIKCGHEYLFIGETRAHFGELSLRDMLEEIKAIAGM